MNNTINLPQLHRLLADASGLPDSMVENFVKALFDYIAEKLEQKGIAVIPKIGTFKADTDAADIIFYPDPALAKAVNEPFSFFEAVPLNVDPDELETVQDKQPHEITSDRKEITDDSTENYSDNTAGPDENIPDNITEENETTTTELIALSAAVPETENQDCAPDTDYDNSDSDGYTTEYDNDEVVHVTRAWPIIAGVLAGLVTGIIIGFLLCHHLYIKNGPDKQLAMSQSNPEKKTSVPADTVAVYLIDNPSKTKLSPDSTESNTAPAVMTDTVTATRFLASMARKYYGTTEFWIYIYEENRDILPANPNRIKPGTAVVIPPIEKYVKNTDKAQARAEASRKIAELERSLR